MCIVHCATLLMQIEKRRTTMHDDSPFPSGRNTRSKTDWSNTHSKAEWMQYKAQTTHIGWPIKIKSKVRSTKMHATNKSKPLTLLATRSWFWGWSWFGGRCWGSWRRVWIKLHGVACSRGNVERVWFVCVCACLSNMRKGALFLQHQCKQSDSDMTSLQLLLDLVA